MKEKEIFSTNYTKTELKPQSKKTYKNPEQKRLKKYKTLKEVIFSTTANTICCCKGESSKNFVSIFSSNEAVIFDTLTSTEIANLIIYLPNKLQQVLLEKMVN